MPLFADLLMSRSADSFTVTVKEQDAVFPAALVTLQVTVVAPDAKLEPLGGVQPNVVLKPQESVTVGAKVTIWLDWLGAALVVMLSGQVMLGGVSQQRMTAVLWLVTPILFPSKVRLQRGMEGAGCEGT